MVDPAFSADRVIQTCRQIEFTLAAVYHALAELHRDVPDLAAVWTKTAFEEENHGRQFELASRLPGAITEAALQPEAAEEMLTRVREFDARMREAAPAPVEALRAMISMEKSLAGYHMALVGTFANPGTKKMFEAMMAADKRHAGTLIDAFRRLAPSDAVP